MSKRIFTFLTRNATGVPTAAGTYFDPILTDVDVDLADNINEQTVQEGWSVTTHDNAAQLPKNGILTLAASEVDHASGSLYVGLERYLGNALYSEHVNHQPICIFQEASSGDGKKCYVALMKKFDPVLAAHATGFHAFRTYLERYNSPKAFTIRFIVLLDGFYTDIDDITTASWTART